MISRHARLWSIIPKRRRCLMRFPAARSLRRFATCWGRSRRRHPWRCSRRFFRTRPATQWCGTHPASRDRSFQWKAGAPFAAPHRAPPSHSCRRRLRAQVRHEAAEAIGSIAGEESKPLLERFAKDSDSIVGEGAQTHDRNHWQRPAGDTPAAPPSARSAELCWRQPDVLTGCGRPTRVRGCA